MRCLVVLFALVLAPALAAAEPLLVSFGEQGLKLGETSLYARPVDGAAHDPEQELIWFSAAGTLYVIDLRDARRKPIVIATRFPAGPFAIDGIWNAEYDKKSAGIYPVVVVGKSPKIKTGIAPYGGKWKVEDAPSSEPVRKIRLTGKKWLTRQVRRKARPITAIEVGLPSGHVQVPLAAKADCNHNGFPCGDTAPFGDTPFQLVINGSNCGTDCRSACLFYDPNIKKFADPAATSTWSPTPPATGSSCFRTSYGLRPGGEYFLGGSRCKVSTSGVTCTASDGWTHVGWVE